MQYYAVPAYLRMLEQGKAASLVLEHSGLTLALQIWVERTVKRHAVLAAAVEEQSRSVVLGRKG